MTLDVIKSLSLQSDSVNFGNCLSRQFMQKFFYFFILNLSFCTHFHVTFGLSLHSICLTLLHSKLGLNWGTKWGTNVPMWCEDEGDREGNTTSLKSPRLTWNYSLTCCQARDLTKCARDWLYVCLCASAKGRVCVCGVVFI